MSAVKDDRLIEEKWFHVFRQEIKSELKSEILELKTETEKLKVSLVDKQVRETTASKSCHQIKMISEVANKNLRELFEENEEEEPLFSLGFQNAQQHSLKRE